MTDRMNRRTNGRALLGLDENAHDDTDMHRKHQGQSEMLLEQHNDERLSQLSEKVSIIRQVTVDIEAQVKESNKMLSEMEGDMDNVQGLLSNTISKLDKLAKSGGGRHMLYLVLFMLFVFLLLYFLMSRGSS